MTGEAASRIRAVLFDADGVVQRQPSNWFDRLQELLGPGRDPERFLEEVFEAEIPLEAGGDGFRVGLAGVLRRWSRENSMDEFLSLWTTIDVDREVTATIRELRGVGIRCYLATNQERSRARYMSESLGYRELFDMEFYSCDLELPKPAPAFFLAILEAVPERPDELLFVDDNETNVFSAGSVGIRGVQFELSSGGGELRRLLGESGLPIA